MAYCWALSSSSPHFFFHFDSVCDFFLLLRLNLGLVHAIKFVLCV